MIAFSRDDLAVFNACTGANPYPAWTAVRDQRCSHAARPIAGDFCFTAVGVDQTGLDVGIDGRGKPFHAICAEAVVTIANPAAELLQISRRMFGLDDQKIIAASGGLDKGNHHDYSDSWLTDATRSRNESDWRKRSISSLCSRRVPSTVKTIFSLPLVRARCIPCMPLLCSSSAALTS